MLWGVAAGYTQRFSRLAVPARTKSPEGESRLDKARCNSCNFLRIVCVTVPERAAERSKVKKTKIMLFASLVLLSLAPVAAQAGFYREGDFFLFGW